MQAQLHHHHQQQQQQLTIPQQSSLRLPQGGERGLAAQATSCPTSRCCSSTWSPVSATKVRGRRQVPVHLPALHSRLAFSMLDLRRACRHPGPRHTATAGARYLCGVQHVHNLPTRCTQCTHMRMNKREPLTLTLGRHTPCCKQPGAAAASRAGSSGACVCYAIAGKRGRQEFCDCLLRRRGAPFWGRALISLARP